MPTNLSHFAINADDVPATRAFYEAVLGWSFTPWGPPGFFKIDTGEGGIPGALQQRRDLLDGQPMVGLECTFSVPDIDAVAKAVLAAGGTILMDRFTIAGVGHLIFFRDPSGNAVGAMQYDPAAE